MIEARTLKYILAMKGYYSIVDVLCMTQVKPYTCGNMFNLSQLEGFTSEAIKALQHSMRCPYLNNLSITTIPYMH